jgi:hypothetical protein
MAKRAESDPRVTKDQRIRPPAEKPSSPIQCGSNPQNAGFITALPKDPINYLIIRKYAMIRVVRWGKYSIVMVHN